MKRADFEKYLGKKVEIQILGDDDIYEGILHKTGEEIYKNNANLYVPNNLYFVAQENGVCVGYLFRVSHVSKIKIIG